MTPSAFSTRQNDLRRVRLPRRSRTAFTMVEMLTVIGIIVILMAILLPVVAKVRQQVRVAQTQQQMNKIAGAIDHYFLEFNHSYPGPLPNSVFATGSASVPISGMTMTENMVLGLCGGLDYSSSGTPTYNSSEIQSGLGPLNLNPNVAKRTRHASFIDATPGQQMPDLGWDASNGGNGKTGTSDSYVPEFMDKFSSYNGGQARPILYMRARTGNPAANAGNVTAPDETSTQYNYNHLLPYQNTSGPTPDFSFGQSLPTANPTVFYYANWQTYLGNPNLTGSPRGVNAYILISAGADGVFGSQDDLFYP